MEIVCAFIGVCLASFFIGFVFGSLSRNKEIAHKDLTIAEYMGENSLFSEYPNLYPRLRGMIAYILSSQFAVSIPESEYSGWQTFGQAANTVFKHQYRR